MQSSTPSANGQRVQLMFPGFTPGPIQHPTYQRAPSPRGPADTSRAAAQDADNSGRSGTKREILRSVIHAAGQRGATIDELQQVTGWLVQSICPAVKSLESAGEIRDSGKRRPTRSGCAAKVWVSVKEDSGQ